MYEHSASLIYKNLDILEESYDAKEEFFISISLSRKLKNMLV